MSEQKTMLGYAKRPLGTYRVFLVIIVLLFLSYAAVDWDFYSLTDSNQRKMAFKRVLDWMSAFASPDLSKEYLGISFILTLQTLSAAVIATVLAIIAAFFISLGSSERVCIGIVGSKGANYMVMRSVCLLFRLLQDILRAVPDFVWAVILVAVIGLGPLTGALALALSMSGILAKIYSELYDNIDLKKYEQVHSLTASRINVFFYAIAPLSSRAVTSITLMRAECAVRNATVIGVVGGGGLGSEMWYNIQFGNWSRVTTLLIFTLLLTLSADLVSNLIRGKLRSDANDPKILKRQTIFSRLSSRIFAAGLTIFILIWSFWFMAFGNNDAYGNSKNHLIPAVELLNGRAWKNLVFFKRLLRPDFDLKALGIGESTDNVKNSNNVRVNISRIFYAETDDENTIWQRADEEFNKWLVYRVVKSAVIPLSMAVIGTFLGFILAVILTYFHSVSFNLKTFCYSGENLVLYQKVIGWLKIITAKSCGLIARGIPEVSWAFLLVAFFGPGVLPGTIAIAIHSTGVLVRVFSESIDNISYRCFEQSYKGSNPALFSVVAVPVAWKDWVTYTFFQFESNVRMAVVLGIVGAGGLGFLFSFNFEWFRFEQASTFLLMIIALTVITDRISRKFNFSRV